MAETYGPPEIPGYRFVRHLASGGFGQVNLYADAKLGREVAVKVIGDGGLTDEELAEVMLEGRRIAALKHPNIVEIYDTGVASDGRPYLVMKYYDGPTFAKRSTSQRLSPGDIVHVGIQLASAIETVHRAGLRHGDIKPANILSDRYGIPALTDFGIARAIDAGTSGGLDGMSIPWAPPEVVFASATPDARADIYSLAATLWGLLIGRSPFEEPGGDNSHTAVMRRIKAGPPATTGRAEVPQMLERFLRNAMAKDPVLRPRSAVEFGRVLQGIAQELHLPFTSLQVPDEDDGQIAARPSAAPETRAKPVQRVVAQQPADPPRPVSGGSAAAPDTARKNPVVVTGAQTPLPMPPPGPAPAGAPGAVSLPPRSKPAPAPRVPVGPPAAATRPRIEPVSPAAPDPGLRLQMQARIRRRRIWFALALVLVIGAGAGGALALGGGSKKAADAAAGPSEVASAPDDSGIAALPGVPVVRADSTTPGVAVFRWRGYDNPLPGDGFRWRRTGSGSATTGTASAPVLTVKSVAGGSICLAVQVVRSDGSAVSPFSDPVCTTVAAGG